MSKKNSKKYDTDPANILADAPTNPEATSEATPKPAIVRKNPQIYLSSGSESWKFTHFPLPKKAELKDGVMIDGSPVQFQATSNKGFTKPDTVINYTWMTLPSGHTGYIALDYNVEQVAGQEFTTHEGTCERKDPERVAKDEAVGTGRVAKFIATMAARKAEAPMEAPATETEPAGV